MLVFNCFLTLLHESLRSLSLRQEIRCLLDPRPPCRLGCPRRIPCARRSARFRSRSGRAYALISADHLPETLVILGSKIRLLRQLLRSSRAFAVTNDIHESLCLPFLNSGQVIDLEKLTIDILSPSIIILRHLVFGIQILAQSKRLAAAQDPLWSEIQIFIAVELLKRIHMLPQHRATNLFTIFVNECT